ncbi:hypothetical protein ACWDHW_39395 [Streptomyces melanosporofaciens]|uniref:Uncharacterized protein n=1 Tax=Streptomyces malaysiensis subsp. samsunensis TaxID=459658 RepID=A0A9X2LTY6_STRMQ|nr:hypothetical protein [Streptomyces samsunensis]MCQ8829492.1 hypothetical protein [Streptomyces samsunensis]
MTTKSSTSRLLAVPAAGITLTVTGDPRTVAALEELAAPFFPPSCGPDGRSLRTPPAPESHWQLDLVRGPAGGTAEAEPDGTPAHRTDFDTAARRITVLCAEAEWLPVIGLRYARTLSRAVAIGAGAVPLHGAAVELAGTGIILTGEKMAGKTTAALSLVRSGGALISNDDVLLVAGPEGWRMVGGPRSVGIRMESLGEHRPVLSAARLAEATGAHPSNRPGKRFLAPGAVERIGGSVQVQAPAHVLIELVSDPDRSVRHRSGDHALDDKEAATVLRAYLEDAADRRRFDLIDALGAPPPSLTADVLGSVVGSLRFFRFTHPVSGWVDAFLDFARAVAPVSSAMAAWTVTA